VHKIILAAMAASALSAVPANAQSANNSGTISVSGTVASKCTATQPLNGSVALGELAQASGTVNRTFSNAEDGALTKTFTVTCTSPSANLSVNALPLKNDAVTTSRAATRILFIILPHSPL
jgi:hypothetical protein